jgi:hypothetical protein
MVQLRLQSQDGLSIYCMLRERLQIVEAEKDGKSKAGDLSFLLDVVVGVLVIIANHAVISVAVAVTIVIAIVDESIGAVLHGLLVDSSMLFVILRKLSIRGNSTGTGGWLINTAALDLVESGLLLGRSLIKVAAGILFIVVSLVLNLLSGRLAFLGSLVLLRGTILFCSVSSVPIWVLTCALKVCGDSFTCNALAVFTSDGCRKVSKSSVKI